MSAQQWNKLLLKQRIGVEKSTDDDFRSPFQRDIDRIILVALSEGYKIKLRFSP